MDILESASEVQRPGKIYLTCVSVVLEVFAVLIGVALHDFFTAGQVRWETIYPQHADLIFWSAFVALLGSALSYFVGGALYLHSLYVIRSKTPPPSSTRFLIAIASRVVFGVLILWTSGARDFPDFLRRLAWFAAVGCGWSLLHVIKKFSKSRVRLAAFWLKLDSAEALTALALRYAFLHCGGMVAAPVFLGGLYVLFFAVDLIYMVKISVEHISEEGAPSGGSKR